MTKREEFIQEFNALLKKFDVELTVRQRTFAYQSVADGIDIEFNFDENEGIIETIECGMWLDEI